MRILLATGIYPPQIGGPATYVRSLAECLTACGHEVRVLAYGEADPGKGWSVTSVPKGGGPLLRWRRYAAQLRLLGVDCDVIEAFSSVSAGVPLYFARMTGKKTVLRLGGDFAWERATDRGDTRTLREWYAARPYSTKLMQHLLRSFSHIVFSSAFQQGIYTEAFSSLPEHSVIENALPSDTPRHHHLRRDLHLLFLGRFVRFKNLASLVRAMPLLPEARLTLVGEGPEGAALATLIRRLRLQDRIEIRPPAIGHAKRAIFDEHDLFVLPSLTEISPNAALEARAAGLPVLLTEETGLSDALSQGMVRAPLREPEEIAGAVDRCVANYPQIAAACAQPSAARSWAIICNEHQSLFSHLASSHS